MKILITGAVGHIGSNLCWEAIMRGHQVVAMDNLHREGVLKNLQLMRKTFTSTEFEFVWGDVRNLDDFDRVSQVDAIIHLAANPGIPWSIQWPRYDFKTNAEGTLNALEFARKMGNVPFVYASTNKTFSDVINNLPTEEQEKRYVWKDISGINGAYVEYYSLLEGTEREGLIPMGVNENFPVQGFGKYGHSMYGISKLTGELYATEYHVQYGLPVVINKMSCIFGLHQAGAIEQGWVSHFIKQVGFGDGNITFFGNGKQVRDVLDARDVARLYLDEVEQIDKSNGQVFTVGGGSTNTVSLLEAVEEIENQTSKKATISFEPKRSADQDIYISSLKTVKEVMGWEPKYTFKETVADMIKEYSI